MPTVKNTAQKKQKLSTGRQVGTTETVGDPLDDASGLIPAKSKIPLEIEEADVIHPLVEEKLDDDPLVKEEESDELAPEEAVLDEEELNPFGDKWEQ